jgi:hypothetical protein
MEVVALPVGRKGEGIGDAMGEGSVGIRLRNLSHEGTDQSDLLASLTDFNQSHLLGDIARENASELLAVEGAASYRAILIDHTGAFALDFPMSGAGLKEIFDPLLPADLQPECGKPSGLVSRLELDRVKEHAVTTHATAAAEILCAPGGVRISHPLFPWICRESFV